MGLCIVQADCRGGVQSKSYCVPLWVDAAEPAYRSRLWLGRSPACTHLSPGDRNIITSVAGSDTKAGY